MEINVERKNREEEHEGYFGKQIAKMPDAMFELGLGRPQFQTFKHLAELRVTTGVDDERFAAAADHVRPHESGVRAPRQRGVRREHAGSFFHRISFACQRRLVDKQVARFEQPAIAGNDCARRQEHHIAGHDLLQRHETLGTVTQRRRLGFHHRSQLCYRIRCTTLLPETEQTAGQHDRQNDSCVTRVL